MGFTASQVLEFVQENDVKFIRLAFCNLDGSQKNISVMAPELPHVFREGICVDVAASEGFVGDEDGDVFLFPDPDTLAILPWRPSHGRVVRLFCEMRRADGSPSLSDTRALLQQSVRRAAEQGFCCNIGCECEFYLFELDELGQATLRPQDWAGYCDVAPLDKGENVRREICLALEDMGIRPQSSHHERGPGQNEIVCHYEEALTAADALVSFRSVSQVIAARNGLSACFLPKPLADQNGSCLHINLSLAKDGVNLFRAGGEHNPQAESFLAGILRRLREITLFLNPLPSSYGRIGSDITNLLTWSHQNRNQLVRIPAADGEYSRMELRSPDMSLNPYLAFLLLQEAGLEGVRDGLPLVREIPPERAERLPGDLGQALEIARGSAFIRSVIPQRTLDSCLEAKRLQYETAPRRQ